MSLKAHAEKLEFNDDPKLEVTPPESEACESPLTRPLRGRPLPARTRGEV